MPSPAGARSNGAVAGRAAVAYDRPTRTPEDRPLQEMVKELDRMLDTQPDEHVRELIWELIADVNE